VIRLSSDAEAHLDALSAYYEDRDRPEATIGLLAAVVQAAARIEHAPEAGLSAPRPYPSLAHLGRRWIKEGPYWIVYSTTRPPVILGVFHEAADIPSRL